MTTEYTPSLSQDLLNPLARITEEFKSIREDEKYIRIKKEALLKEINDHHFYGNIKDSYSENGIKISKKNLPKRYQFSEVVIELETKLNKQKELEIEDEIAVREKRGFTWAITLEK
tara:strand:- start:12032 stop:12379 length:348 start_codon:yes stop_codon:yes gene_type:complete